VLPGQSDVVRPRCAEAQEHLRDEDPFLVLPFERLAEDLLGCTKGVDICRINCGHSGVGAHVQHSFHLVDAEIAHLAEAVTATNRHRPEAENRYAQA
jgi:hypothetical protein